MIKSKVRKQKAKVYLAFALSLVLAACAPSSGEPKPPEIAYGRDICDACGMIISEARFAAATLTTDGKTLKFDDAGEMFNYHAKHPELSVRVWFVHDYNSQQWINGQAAFYVMAKEIKSPMGTGVAAFSDKASADAFANRYGVKALTFDEIRAAKPMMGGH
jgi:copper chaperone NosL